MVLNFLRRPWTRRPAQPPAAPAVPSGTCVYAVGDVHGELGALTRLLGKIREDADRAGAERRVLIFLGDYRVFLEKLALSHVEGDYVFVHAGVRPGIPLQDQQEQDLLWIRDEFIRDRSDHCKVVVHGHSVTDRPDVQRNRIGIDTGAYATGRLTCLVLEEASRRFLTAA